MIELISDFKDLTVEFDLIEDMCAAAGAPLSLSLAQGIGPQSWRDVLARIDAAVARGVADARAGGAACHRRTAGFVGHGKPVRYPSNLPHDCRSEPLAERVARLRRPEVRAALLAEQPAPGFKLFAALMADFTKVWALGDPPDYEPAAGGEQSWQPGRAAAGYFAVWTYLLLMRMLEDGWHARCYTRPLPTTSTKTTSTDCRDMILAPNTVMGLGDGGAHVGTICDASYSTYLLAHWGKAPDPR